MSDNRLVAIAEKLLDQSRRGEISWVETADESSFSVAFPTYSVSIQRPDSSTYAVGVYNKNGTEIDSITARRRDVKLYKTLQVLFIIARRVALKTDQVLDDLLDRLSSKEAPA